jgi:DNA-binding beta-propeller fold protein YncE
VPGLTDLKGICASAATGRLYVSNNNNGNASVEHPVNPGTMLCLDLLTDQVLWRKQYEPGVDRMAMTADGKKIYMPTWEYGGTDYNLVIDGLSGNVIGKIQVGAAPHDNLANLSGSRCYMICAQTNILYVVDTASDQVVQQVGPFQDDCRPFTFDAKETRVYMQVDHLFGFQVADLATGKVLYTVPITGPFKESTTTTHPSHGIALTPDGRELWVCDAGNPYIHIFDATVSPPRQIADVQVGAPTHWVTCSIDGRFVYPMYGDDPKKPIDVIDAKTRTKVGTVIGSRQMMEVDFRDGQVIRVGDQYGVGRNN